MSKICIKCGAELEDSASFCEACGEKQPVQDDKNQLNINNQGNADGTPLEKNRKQSGLGIASFILGIISIITFGLFFLPEILGIILGIISVCNKTKKKGFAIAGLAMSGVMTLFIIALLASDSPSTDTADVESESAVVEKTVTADLDNTDNFAKSEVTSNMAAEETGTDVIVETEQDSVNEETEQDSVNEETIVSDIETLNGKPYLVDVNLRSIYVEINYNANLFFDGGRVTVFLDNKEIGKVDSGGQYAFSARLQTGEHTIMTKRSSDDVDTYVLYVEKGEGAVCYESQCVLFEYTYDSMPKEGELKKVDEYDAGSWCIHYGKMWGSEIIDFAVSDVDSKNLDKSKSIDLTDFLESSSSSKELVSKLQSEYTIDFRTKDAATYEALGIGISEKPAYDEDNGKYLMMFLDNTYAPLCVLKDIWCGMDYETAYNNLVRLTYNDSVDYLDVDSNDGNGFRIGKDLIYIERNNGRVSWILYYKYIDRESFNSSNSASYEVTVTDDNMEPCELYYYYNFGEITNTIENLAWNGYYFIDNGDGSCTSSDGSVIIREAGDMPNYYTYYTSGEPNISIYPSDNNKYSIRSCFSGMTEDEALSALLQQYHVIPIELEEQFCREGYTAIAYQLESGSTNSIIAFHVKDGYVSIIDYWYYYYY